MTNKELKSLDCFLCRPWTWFGGIRAQFPQIASILKYLGSRYNPTHRGESHQSKVSFDVKQSASKTLDYFSCVPAHDFWVFGPSFFKFPHYLSACETSIIRTLCGLDNRARSHCEISSRLWITFHVTLYMIWGNLGTFPKFL